MTDSIVRRLRCAVACTLLAITVAACGDEPAENASGDDAADPASSGPAEFRMSATDDVEVNEPETSYASDTTILRTPDGKPAIYSVESVKIEMVMKGDRSGKVVHYFTDYGDYEAHFDSTQPTRDVGPNIPNHTLSITTPDSTGMYDYDRKSGWKSPNMTDSLPYDSIVSTGTSVAEWSLKQAGAKHMGDTTIRGWKTSVYRIEGQSEVRTYWVWRGIPIRVHVFQPLDDLEFWMDPVKITVPYDPPAGAFKYPEGANMQSRPNQPMPGLTAPPPPEAMMPPEGGQPMAPPGAREGNSPPSGE